MLVHLLDLLRRSARPASAMRSSMHAVDGLGAHVGAHRQHALQRARHRRLVARRQQVGEILARGMRSELTSGMSPSMPDLARLGRRLDRRQRRHVPDHRQRAVFGMQREARPSIPSPSCRPASCLAASSQASGMPSARACAITAGIVRVEENVELRLVQIAARLGRWPLLRCGRRRTACTPR